MAVGRDSTQRWWVVIPAAGSSRRMAGLERPKQYLTLAGRTVIEWALAPFLAREDCAGVVVALHADDRYWRTLGVSADRRIATVTGGVERADSVRAGLAALAGRASEGDWVLVHDAARPCLSALDLEHLLSGLWADAVGGLLATPVVDTLKRADEGGRVSQTVTRASLWHALTPQMFRYGTLVRALEAVASAGSSVTDEAQAVEQLGLQPRLIESSSENLKVTVPADLLRAGRILAAGPALPVGDT
jgi:2-C-methyl-D-erythritol 4-phosphate cytidylyltransferase